MIRKYQIIAYQIRKNKTIIISFSLRTTHASIFIKKKKKRVGLIISQTVFRTWLETSSGKTEADEEEAITLKKIGVR